MTNTMQGIKVKNKFFFYIKKTSKTENTNSLYISKISQEINKG